MTPDPAANVEVVPEAVLNGAQVTAATGIVTSVARGEIPRNSGIGMLEVLFSLSSQQAERIMGEVGRGFRPETPEPPT